MQSGFLMRAIAAMFLAFGFAMAVTSAALAEAVAPFSFDTAYGRLPKNVVPLDYSISITPDVAAMTLTGKESIVLKFRAATATIQLNSVNETLDDVRLDGKPVKTVVSSDEQQLTTITLNKPATIGRHTLKFSYKGKIETAPHGMFAQPYARPNGEKGVLLTSKLEPADARRFFPCWDEPAFRATFELTATVSADLAVVSNMPVAKRVSHGAMATTTFKRTPKMPTYLLEYSAGDLAEISAESRGVKLSVWAVRGQEKDGAIALANAQQILADYNDYFGFPFPLPKLDSIAVPGGFSGAMENWGAITYNDQLLLVTPSSTVGNRQEVYSTQAHEMAHQWNGDLVTMGWWDDLWLNESFASWRAAKEVDLRNPSWKWWELQDENKEGAMTADARVTSHQIQQHVTDELQAQNAFDPAITYDKGQAVLRMLEAYVGEDVFRNGIRAFMKAHAFSNATSTDLWNAVSAASGRDIAAIASGWMEQPGFPLVSVTAQCDATGKRTLALTQRRFLLQGTDPKPSRWSVPLLIRSGANGVPQPFLLAQDSQTVGAGLCDQTLSVNAGAVGYYRVAYDEATLKLNTGNFATLPDADRIAMLDDQWALVESGQQKLASYLALASGMGSGLDERAWTQVIHVLESIEYDVRRTPVHDAFAAYASSIVKPTADRLGWDARPDETPGVQRLRRSLIGNLGAWGDRQIIAEARKRVAAFVADRNAIQVDDQELWLSVVAHNADAAAFDQLHEVAKSAKNETELRRFYTALMHVRDPQLAAQAAQIAESAEIPPQAASLRLFMVGALLNENPRLAWATFTRNHEMYTAPFGEIAPLIIAQYGPTFFWDSAPLDEVEAWVKAHSLPQMAESIARGMETARFRFAEKTMLAQAAESYLNSTAASHGK
jgi:aminopeptidase N